MRLILDALKSATDAGINLLVLPELVVCGYPPMDLLERRSFRERVYASNAEIIARTGDTAILFGTFTENRGSGRRIFNAAILAEGGKKVSETHKTLLPTYDIFDEFRYFEPGKNTSVVPFRSVNLGITICEDIWNSENEIIYHIYDKNPAASLKKQGADLLFNISASPFSKGKAPIRLKMLQNHARELNIPIVYSNQVGANTEVLFDGDSLAMQSDGTVVATTQMFASDYTDVRFDPESRKFTAEGESPDCNMPVEERIFKALVMGIRDYLHKSDIKPNVILGLSGGIDSALVAVLAAEALGPDRVTALTMPSEFSSPGSVNDSKALQQALGITLHEVSIRQAFDAIGATLDPLFAGTDFGVAEENMQSRIRGLLLMAMSNKYGHILLNTGNKSELAVGYCTLYGDMNGGLSVISDLYKTEVYRLAEWLNEHYYGREVIPRNTIDKPPSAELRPDQKDTDSLPPYNVLDEILRRYIEEQQPRAEIIAAGIDPAEVDRILKLVDLNEYKRRQSPPGLRLSAKAFGIGRRLPIVQRWTRHELS